MRVVELRPKRHMCSFIKNNYFICIQQMTISVLIHERMDHIEEIEVDIDPIKNEIFKISYLFEYSIDNWDIGLY